MKGNETRVVIFLQPVNPTKEGEVSTKKQSKWRFSPFSLFLVLGALFGIGMFTFVLFTIQSNVNSGTESTTVSKNVDPTIRTSTITTTTRTTATTTTNTTPEPTTMATNTSAKTLKTTTEITIPTAATTMSSSFF